MPPLKAKGTATAMREHDCGAVGAKGRCSLELRPMGKAAIPAHKESLLLLSSTEFPMSLQRGELEWKLDNVPRRAEKNQKS